MKGLKAARILRDLKVEELAERVGVSVDSIKSYQCGRSNPSVPVLEKIADELKVSTDFLLGRE